MRLPPLGVSSIAIKRACLVPARCLRGPFAVSRPVVAFFAFGRSFGCRRGLLAAVGRLCARVGQMRTLGRLDVDGERALAGDGEGHLADDTALAPRRFGDQALAQQRLGHLGDRAALQRLGQRMDRAVVAPGGGRENDHLGVGEFHGIAPSFG